MSVPKMIGFFFLSGVVWFVIFICPTGKGRDLFASIKLLINASEEFHVSKNPNHHDGDHIMKHKEMKRKKVLESFSSQFEER